MSEQDRRMEEINNLGKQDPVTPKTENRVMINNSKTPLLFIVYKLGVLLCGIAAIVILIMAYQSTHSISIREMQLTTSTDELNKITENKQELSDQIAILKKERSELLQGIIPLRKESNIAKAIVFEYNTVKSKVEKLQLQRSELEGEVVNLEQSKGEIAGLIAQQDARLSSLKENNTRWTKFETDVQKKYTDINVKYELIQTQYAKLSAKVPALQNEVKLLISDKKKLQAFIQKNKTVKNELSVSNSKLKNMKYTLKSTGNSISIKQEEKETMEDQLNELRSSILSLTKDKTVLLVSIAKLDGNSTALSSTITSLEDKVINIKKDISTKKSMQADLAVLEVTEQNIQSSLAKLNSELTATKKEKKIEQEKIDNKKKLVIELNAQIIELTKTNATLTAQLSNTKEKLPEAKNRLQKLSLSQDKLVISISNKKQSINDLTTEIRKLQTELSSIKQLHSDASKAQ